MQVLAAGPGVIAGSGAAANVKGVVFGPAVLSPWPAGQSLTKAHQEEISQELRRQAVSVGLAADKVWMDQVKSGNNGLAFRMQVATSGKTALHSVQLVVNAIRAMSSFPGGALGLAFSTDPLFRKEAFSEAVAGFVLGMSAATPPNEQIRLGA